MFAGITCQEGELVEAYTMYYSKKELDYDWERMSRFQNGSFLRRVGFLNSVYQSLFIQANIAQG